MLLAIRAYVERLCIAILQAALSLRNPGMPVSRRAILWGGLIGSTSAGFGLAAEPESRKQYSLSSQIENRNRAVVNQTPVRAPPCIERVSSTTCVRLRAFSFFIMLRMCTFTVLSHIFSSYAIVLFCCPCQRRCRTSI